MLFVILAIVGAAICICVFGYLTYLILSDKGYKKYFWIGYVFGPIGMIWSIGMPNLKEMQILKEIRNQLENFTIVQK